LQKDFDVNTESTTTPPDVPSLTKSPQVTTRRRPLVPLAIGIGTLFIIAAGATMVVRAEAQVNKISLSQSAKPVTVVEAERLTFRGARSYVGTIEFWVEAKIGP